MIEFPEALPTPFIDFSGRPRNASIVSSEESGIIERRHRFIKAYDEVSVEWRFASYYAFTTFEDFFNDDLGMGTALFSIGLRYPTNSQVVDWVCRFLEGYEYTENDGVVSVAARLDLIRPLVLPAEAIILSVNPLFVISEESGEGHILFVTSEGSNYYVRD